MIKLFEQEKVFLISNITIYFFCVILFNFRVPQLDLGNLADDNNQVLFF